jgi:hypothetical protein
LNTSHARACDEDRETELSLERRPEVLTENLS